MDSSTISTILKELNLNEDSVANIYNYGSWVYGTNSATSDRDLMIVTRSSKAPLNFTDDLNYFHDFELHKLWNQYDICVHSIENFEKLLETNYLLAVECIFLPDEFKIKQEIDFRPIYLEKYYNPQRIKQVAFYENNTAINMADLDNDTIYPHRSTQSNQSNNNYLFKNLFHGFRYLNFAQQLIEKKSIENFHSVLDIFNEMKEIRGDSTNDINLQPVLNFIRDKSLEYKTKLNTLIPTIVKGIFEAHITFDCTNNPEECIKYLKNICENSKYKIIFINLNTQENNNKLQQLMTSSYHCGEYPNIIQEIEEEAYRYFKDFQIIRIKIESLASNIGVPESDIEKNLFWNDKNTYFEFHYKVLVDNNQLKQLENICNNHYHFPLHLSHNAFQKLDETHFHYMITLRLFKIGRNNAFIYNDNVINYLTENQFPPLKIVREFIVYDSHIELDQKWK